MPPSVQHESAYLPSRRVKPLACGEGHGLRTLRQADRGLLEESPGTPPNPDGGRRRDHVGVLSNLEAVSLFRRLPIVKIELRRGIESQVDCWNGGCVTRFGSRKQDRGEFHIRYCFLQIVSKCIREIEEGRGSTICRLAIHDDLYGGRQLEDTTRRRSERGQRRDLGAQLPTRDANRENQQER